MYRLAVVCCLPLFAFCAIGQTLVATGSWTLAIDFQDLQAGPGSELVSVHESALGVVVLDVDVPAETDIWHVDMVRTGTWHESLTLEVLSDKGTGGASYKVVSDTSTLFISGTGDLLDVQLRYRVSGMSLQIAPATFSPTVSFTLVVD